MLMLILLLSWVQTATWSSSRTTRWTQRCLPPSGGRSQPKKARRISVEAARCSSATVPRSLASGHSEKPSQQPAWFLGPALFYVGRLHPYRIRASRLACDCSVEQLEVGQRYDLVATNMLGLFR